MPDLYAFPIISRLFYLKGSIFDKEIYQTFQFENRFPLLFKWFSSLKAHPDFTGKELNESIIPYDKAGQNYQAPELNAIVPTEYFQLWLEELS